MNIDYLKYDAQSIIEYLRRKLIESGVYTDQIYPASDIKLLMDLFAWTFEVLQYILNNNAADVIFSDTEIYENINRLTKLLSYSPKAYRTSTCEFSLNANFKNSLTATCVIPKYAKIDTNKFDSNGKPISYSLIDDYQFNVKNGNIIYTKNNLVLANGSWCLYTFDKLAEGSNYEIFTMTDISPANGILVDNDNFDVFVESISNEGEKSFQKIKIVDSLILDAASNDLCCEKRLNEKKEFELKFGDGIHGMTLPAGVKVHVMYLRSNGVNGKIVGNEISSNLISLSIEGISSTTEMISMLYGGIESFKIKYGELFTNSLIPLTECRDIILTSVNGSSDVLDYETVDEIRENAPKSFRIGQRLVTTDDFRTYVMSEFSNRISDAYVCNNNEYMMTFYRWLDIYGKFDASVRLENYEYMDAVDFNNIYIWIKPNNISMTLLDSDKKLVVKRLGSLKTVTSNIVPCEGIKKFFVPYVKPALVNGSSIADSLINEADIEKYNKTKIVIVKNRTFLSDSTIKKNVVEVIIKYFNEHGKLGDTINISDMVKEIKALGYVDRVITRNENHDVNGLSFATFTKNLMNYADFETVTEYCNLQKFQYPILSYSSSALLGMIEIDNSAFALKNDEI